MSRLLVAGLLLTAIAVGVEHTMVNVKRERSTTMVTPSNGEQHQASIVQRGFRQFDFEIQADSLMRDTTGWFERR